MRNSDYEYETADVVIGNTRRWSKVLILFVVFGVGMATTFYFLIAPSHFEAQPLLPTTGFSNGPLLQDNETDRVDIANLRAKEKQILEHSGPSVEHPGLSRIPIEQAMKDLATTGLPPRPGSMAPNPQPLPSDVLDHGKPSHA